MTDHEEELLRETSERLRELVGRIETHLSADTMREVHDCGDGANRGGGVLFICHAEDVCPAAGASGSRAEVVWAMRETYMSKPAHHHRLIDITGKRVGQWTVVSYYGRIGSGCYWNCRCDCGTEKRILGHHLRNESTRGCMKCFIKRRTVPVKKRICRFCGKRLKKGSRLPFSCMSCERRKLRNGLCECGFPAYKQIACPKCGRAQRKK